METYLAHSGILGMKWGVRRYQYKDGSLTPEGRKRYGSGNDLKSKSPARTNLESQNANSRDVKEMSDEELRRLVSRLQLEQNYISLTSKKNVDKGENIVNKAMKDLGQKILSNLVDQTAKRISKGMINAVFGEDDKKKKKDD